MRRIGRNKSPEHQAKLARWWRRNPGRSPEFLREMRQNFIGSEKERFDAPDPDWCEQHDLSRYDHTASSRCRYPVPS
jgi:hypothetical protein